jgi:F-type H+-transporting ATPase subunit gamma
MSLNELKRFIAGISSIMRTTVAMRILSMSLNTILKKILSKSQKSLNQILEIINMLNIRNIEKDNKEILYIFIGAERSLCGNYTNQIKKKFIEATQESSFNFKYILVGNVFTKLLPEEKKNKAILLVKDFAKKNVENIYKKILEITKINNTDEVRIVYCKTKGLFDKEITTKSIFTKYSMEKDNRFSFGHFNKSEVLKILEKIIIKQELINIIYESLISEQSARFVAMDAATNNAKKMVEKGRMMYNKMRQTRITRDLQNIVSGLSI